jgi:hypothetical protein
MLYRMGGAGPADLQSEWGWVPTFIRKFPKKRDAGCGACVIAGLLIVGTTAPWWALFLAWGCMWGALSTYHDYITGDDNHYLHGLVIGLAVLLPLIWFGQGIALGIYAVALAVTMGLWSGFVGNATWEELGRGFLMPSTLMILWWMA